MVSSTIRNLAQTFAGWAGQGGVHLTTPSCELVRSQLAACADIAEGIEGAPVPPGAAAVPPGNVVSLDDVRRRRAAGDRGAA